MNDQCECSDPGCLIHRGISACEEPADSVLYRIDMSDESGTAMCSGCTDDALESGVFTLGDKLD